MIGKSIYNGQVTLRYVSAKEAAAELGVSLPTLYAYVSRGLLRSHSTGSSQRSRLYQYEDVARLKARREQRRNPGRAAEAALQWGMPVLESSLSLIADGQLFYRGISATELAKTATFEQVAHLLWLGEMPDAERAQAGWPTADDLTAPYASWLAQLDAPAPIEAMQAVLALAAAKDTAAYDLRPASVIDSARRILALMSAAAIFPALPVGRRLAQLLQQAWAPRQPEALRLLEAALILCADHELNVSAFTARCVASAGGTPYGVVLAGLSALQGTRHGGNVGRVEGLLDEIRTPARAADVLNKRLRRGEGIPGFGHALYPDGDPRARLLLELLAAAMPRSGAIRLARGVTAAAEQLIGEQPTIDLALAVLGRALDLPRGAPLALFALGRTAGWMGHALEQYAAGTLIRPRARYVGPAPRS